MYPGITLYPGGAFVLCESVGEFDDNVQYPVPGGDVATAAKEIGSTDPVAKAISQFNTVYSNWIVPLLNMEFGYTDVNDGVHKLSVIASSMTETTNALLRQIGKITGVLRIARNYGEYTMQDFSPHVGYFMKNIQKIKQQGVEFCTINWREIPALAKQWNVEAFIDIIGSMPELMGSIMPYSTIGAASRGETDLFEVFDSPVDLIKCVCTDMDRVIRLESEMSRRFSVTELIRRRPDSDCGDVQIEYDDTRIDRMSRKYFRMASLYLRDVSRTCYDAQCELLDNNMSSEQFTELTKPLLAKCVNVFAIGLALLMFVSYSLREINALKDGVNDYTKLLLNVLKTV